MTGLSLSLGLSLSSLAGSGGTPTPTPSPVITFDGTTIANTLGNAGQWYADGVAIEGEAGATMAYVEVTMAGRAITQSVGGVLSNVIVVEAAGLPSTLIDFNVADTKLSTYPVTPFTMMGGGGAVQQDKYTVLSNQFYCSPLTLTGTLAIAARDTGGITHFAEMEVVSATYNQCASLLLKVGSEISYIQCFFNATDQLGIVQYDNSASSTALAANGLNLVGLSAVGSKIRLEASVDDKWRILIKRPGDADFLPYGKSASFGAQSPQIDIWYSFSSGLHANTMAGLKGERFGATTRTDNFRYGSLERPIILSIASQARSPDDPAKTRVALSGTYSGGVTAIEYLVTLADGTLVQDWAAGQALSSGTLAGQYVDIPLTSGEDFVIVGRDPSNPATAFKVSGTALLLASVVPYLHSVNESYSTNSSLMSRERNLFGRSNFRTPEVSTRQGEPWGYFEDFDPAETGFDESGQYYSWPAGVTYAFIAIGRGMKAGQYDIDCSGMAASVEVGQSQNVNIITPFSGGAGRIEITQDYDYNITLRISNTAPIATGGLGPATITCFKVGETDKVSYLSDPFKAHMAAGHYRAYRNMAADLSAPFTGLVNRGSNVVGMLCPKAWGEVSYLNGSIDLHVCIPHLADAAWITAYATALRDEGNINPASFILVENSNEVWNPSDAYLPQYNWHMFEGVKLGYYVSSGAPVPIPSLIDGLVNDYVDPSTGALKIALAPGDAIICNRYSTGRIVMQTAIARNIGDPVPVTTGSNWTLLVNTTGTSLAQRLMYSERSAMIFDCFDAVFGAAKIKPVAAWWHAAGFTAMADILAWNDLYLKMVGRGIPMTAPYWGHSFGDRSYNGYPGWTATERALLTTNPSAFKDAFFVAATGVVNAAVDSDVLFAQQLAQWLVDRGQSVNALRKGSYEINWHATFGNDWPVELIPVFAEIVRDSRMGDLVTLQATRTRDEVGGYQMWFHRGGKVPSGFLLQYWGMTENEYDIGPDNARWTALAAVGAGA